jgi:RimJ/RimL family protein N-acetyltransferase
LAELTFRPMTSDDLPLLHEWLQRPHVRRWWSDHPTLDDVVRHYGPSVNGEEASYHYFAYDGATPVAMLQTYRLADWPESAAKVGAEPGAAGVDLFVADAARTGRGLGSTLIRRFVDEIVFARDGATHCLADPEVENHASIRAFEKAGFRVVGEFDDPDDGKRHAVVRKDRSRPGGGS